MSQERKATGVDAISPSTQRQEPKASAAGKPGAKAVSSPRASKKRDQIVDAALQLFLEEGFHGTSMDAIAVKAAVSKPTLYSKVGNKEQLFEYILSRSIDEILLPTKCAVFEDKSIEETLYDFARNYASVLLSPHLLALHRLAVGEAQRFPKLGNLFYEAGPRKVLDGMSHFLAVLARRGDLDVKDPTMAAHHFWGMVINPQRNAMLFLGEKAMSKAEVQRYIRDGVAAFLRAYRATK